MTAALACCLSAQGQQAVKPIDFRSPDGSRFVLVPIPDVPQVHWAIATFAGPADEPHNLPGLAIAVQRASLNGTRQTGSLDPEAEGKALVELDLAYAELLANPGDVERMQRVNTLRQHADSLSDHSIFGRVLAAAPAYAPVIGLRDGVAVLQLTTLASSLQDVGHILIDRRENQVLRGLPAQWMREITARQNAFDNDPLTPVYAELLALAIPDHPAVAAGGRPGRSMPRRTQGLKVWMATQHPNRTVQVLLGNFDPAVAQQVLQQTFTSTQLPAPPPTAQPTLRPIRNQRRSTVIGTGRNMVAMAWTMPDVDDPLVLEAAVRWLQDQAVSPLADKLRRAGHKTATLQCRAPWPMAAEGRGLFLLEVTDPTSIDGLANLLVTACSEIVEKKPSNRSVHSIAMALQRDWTMITADPRWLAAETARSALLWPRSTPRITRRVKFDPVAIQSLLQAVFANQPVIVEAKP